MILPLRKKAKVSFIQSHSLDIYRVCVHLLCLGSCERAFIHPRPNVNRVRECSDASCGSRYAVDDRKCRSSASRIETFKQEHGLLPPKKRKSTLQSGCCMLSRSAQFYPKPPAFALHPQPIKELGGAPFISVKNTLAG